MILQSYQPSTADVLLWYPKKPREYLICWILRSRYHHASLLSANAITEEAYVLDQNIDLVSEDPVPLQDLLKCGYSFDIYRFKIPLSEFGKNEIKRSFNLLRQFHYPYLGSLKVPFGQSFLPKGVYPERFIAYTAHGYPKLDILFRAPFCAGYGCTKKRHMPSNNGCYWYETYDKITCSGAVVIAFCVAHTNCFVPVKSQFDPEQALRHPIFFLPEDFTSSQMFIHIGKIDSNTQLHFS